MYSIGQFSKHTGIPVSTLRFYDSEGILIPEIRKENGYRYYSGNQAVTAIFISNMKMFGIPLESIRELAYSDSPEEILEKISEQKNRMLDMLKGLQILESYYSNSMANSASSDVESASISVGFLKGTHYISSKADCENRSIHQFLDEFGMPLLVKCHQMENIRQTGGMRILCGRLCGLENDQLIIPVDGRGLSPTEYMKEQKTVRIVLRKKEFAPYEDFSAFLEIVKKRGHEVVGTPVAELLIDPGDVPRMQEYVICLHAPIR